MSKGHPPLIGRAPLVFQLSGLRLSDLGIMAAKDRFAVGRSRYGGVLTSADWGDGGLTVGLPLLDHRSPNRDQNSLD